MLQRRIIFKQQMMQCTICGQKLSSKHLAVAGLFA
jgi:hypothetical protein